MNNADDLMTTLYVLQLLVSGVEMRNLLIITKAATADINKSISAWSQFSYGCN